MLFNGFLQPGQKVNKATRLAHEKRDQRPESEDSYDSDSDDAQPADTLQSPSPEIREALEKGVLFNPFAFKL